MDLGCLTVGPCQTAETIKPAGANGEGGVEFAGVFCVGLFLLASGSADGEGERLHLREL